MDNLKLCSLRIDNQSLELADNIAKNSTYWSKSDIMRLAIWIGLKVIKSHRITELNRLYWSEMYNGENVLLEHVLHAAGVSQNHLNGSE